MSESDGQPPVPQSGYWAPPPADAPGQQPPPPTSSYWRPPPTGARRPRARRRAQVPVLHGGYTAPPPSAAELARRHRAFIRRRRFIVFFGISAALIATGLIIGLVAVHGGSHPAASTAIPTGPGVIRLSQNGSATSPVEPPSSASSSTSATPTMTSSGPLSASDAQAAVVRYIQDVNARDRTAAGQLICASEFPNWQRNADSTHGDFAYTVVGAQFLGAQPQKSTGAVVITYQLKFNDDTTNTVDFTVIQDDGAKLCGISNR